MMQFDSEIVQALVAKGANVNEKDKFGMTALMYVFAKGHFSIVQALLDAGANVNMKDKNGLTALMRAAANGNTESVQALLAKGAKVNEKDPVCAEYPQPGRSMAACRQRPFATRQRQFVRQFRETSARKH